MSFSLKAGLASAALAVAACVAPVAAADLGGYPRGGSIKDTYVPEMPAIATAGPCYFRTDTGYSWSSAPNGEYVGNGTDPHVYNANLKNTTLLEAGLGCGQGSRGFRAEMMAGIRNSRTFTGDVNIVVNNQPVDPPIETRVQTYSMMFNTYYDFGKHAGFVPYVGAGIGFAYHKMGDVTITDPNSPAVQFGDEQLSFAWALMAGVGYQLSERMILDVGYRYIDMGLARSSHGDNTFAFWNPRLELDDLRAHEFKLGLRYHFGGGDCCQHAAMYAPMK